MAADAAADAAANAAMPMLRLRQMTAPAPSEDLLAAARYSLERDVTAALSAAPVSGWAHASPPHLS